MNYSYTSNDALNRIMDAVNCISEQFVYDQIVDGVELVIDTDKHTPTYSEYVISGLNVNKSLDCLVDQLNESYWNWHGTDEWYESKSLMKYAEKWLSDIICSHYKRDFNAQTYIRIDVSRDSSRRGLYDCFMNLKTYNFDIIGQSMNGDKVKSQSFRLVVNLNDQQEYGTSGYFIDNTWLEYITLLDGYGNFLDPVTDVKMREYFDCTCDFTLVFTDEGKLDTIHVDSVILQVRYNTGD